MNKYIISDTHFGDKNIINYENRPFSLLDEMDNCIINKWNDIVNSNDEVYHLGDVSKYNKEKTKEIITKLNGYKILVMGNHDEHLSVEEWKECGFNLVIPYTIILNGFYILSHKPVYLNENMPYVNIHGHTHNISFDNKKYINVCIEKTDYEPILFSDIINKFN